MNVKAPSKADPSKLVSAAALEPQAPVTAQTKVSLAAANEDKAVGASVSVSGAFKQVALERSRSAVATGQGSAGEAGAAAAMGGAGFSRLRPGAAPNDTVEVDPKAIVWTNEGRVRSDSKTTEAPIVGEVHLSEEGIKIQLIHVSGEKPLSTVKGHQPFEGGQSSPTDAFVQSQTAQTLASYLKKLSGMGLDLASVYRDNVSNSGVIRVFVNAADILNAAYVPSRNIYFFGNYKGTFPLATDKDTIVHESSHGLLDHIAPGLNRGEGEGGAFHEAFGDIMATLSFQNPGVGEDLGTFLVETKDQPEELRNGIRRVDNQARLEPNVTEVHDRSLPYSGLMWSAMNVLAKAVGQDKAVDIMMGAYVKGAFFITNQNPSSSDIVEALAEGIRSHLGQVAPEHTAPVIRALLTEAKQRGMLDVPTSERSKSEDGAPANSAADVVKMISQHPDIAKRPDVSFEVIRDCVMNDVRKVTVRPVVNDKASGAKLAVEDSHLTVVMENGKAVIVDGSAFSIPQAFNLSKGLPDIQKGADAAREIIRQQLEAAASQSEQAAKILESFDTLFADKNIQADWVISRGTVCVSLETLAGDFVVDVVKGHVWQRDTMRIEDDHLAA